MRPARRASILLLLPLGGCMLGVEHMLGTDLSEHRWHQWPARVGMFVVTVPLTVVLAPVALLEDVSTGSSLFRKQSPGISSYLVGVPATAGAYLVALPFFVVGLPWEFAAKPAPPPPPDDDQDPG